jgi:hypothetical protein
MKTSWKTILGSILLTLIVIPRSFAQGSSGVSTLTIDQVKERVTQSYSKHQRLTVKIRSNGFSTRERSVSGSIQAVNSDDFVLRRDDLFGGHHDLVIAFSEVIGLKRQHELERVAKIIGNNAAVAPIVPLVAICMLLGARG